MKDSDFNKANILIYCSSRNNYEMLIGEIFQNVNFEGFDFINVDDNSCDEQILLGKKICNENNIVFLNNIGRGLSKALQTAVDYANSSEKNYKFIFWLTHDCYPITKNIFSKLSKLIDSGSLGQFGCVGFNTVWKKFICSEAEFKRKNPNGKSCAVMGRSVLTPVPGVGWLRPTDFNMEWEVWGKNIAVESIVDMNMMFNIEKYNKHIDCDNAFHHFCWGDDIGLQFLKSNVYNITLCNFYVYHDQEIKARYRIPVSSYRAAAAGNSYYFCEHDRHYDHWENKWGFKRAWQTKLDKLPQDIINRYKGTLIEKFMNHDYNQGPIKTFSIE